MIEVVLNHWTKVRLYKLGYKSYLLKVYTFDNLFITQVRCKSIHEGVRLARMLHRPLGMAA